MRKILLFLTLCTALTALAEQCVAPGQPAVWDPTTYQVPTGSATTPIIPQVGSASWGTAATSGPCPGDNASPPGPWSPGFVCARVWSGNTGVTTSVTQSSTPGFLTCNAYSNGSLINSQTLYQVNCSTTGYCPAGYTLTNGQCKSNLAIGIDASAATAGATVSRDSNGNLTSLSGPNGSFTVTTRDANGRASQIVPPNGDTMSLTYEGDSPRIHTVMTINGTFTYAYYDQFGHVSSVTLPDGSSYNFTYMDKADGSRHINGVGVVNGVIGGARAGTLAPWGVAIPYVTASLKIPDDKMLAMLLEGLEIPEYFHAEPVGLQPYASWSPDNVWTVAYGDTFPHAMDDHIPYPNTIPGAPEPSECTITAGYQPNAVPGGVGVSCLTMLQHEVRMCQALGAYGTAARVACENGIPGRMAAHGCS